MTNEVLKVVKQITPAPLPFPQDKKIFNLTNEEGNIVGEPFSYNDWMKELTNIAGVNPELMGAKE